MKRRIEKVEFFFTLFQKSIPFFASSHPTAGGRVAAKRKVKHVPILKGTRYWSQHQQMNSMLSRKQLFVWALHLFFFCCIHVVLQLGSWSFFTISLVKRLQFCPVLSLRMERWLSLGEKLVTPTKINFYEKNVFKCQLTYFITSNISKSLPTISLFKKTLKTTGATAGTWTSKNWQRYLTCKGTI